MTYGTDAVVELVEERGWSYPVSVTRLEREFALTNVHVDTKGNSIMLGELLTEVDGNQFADEADFRGKLEPVFEAERERRRTGVLGSVKKLFLGTYTR